MGIYLNPGEVRFSEAVNSEIYVDKTEMIRYLNAVLRTEQKFLEASTERKATENRSIHDRKNPSKDAAKDQGQISVWDILE